MSLRSLCFFILAVVILTETAVAVWGRWQPDMSGFPIFSWTAPETFKPQDPKALDRSMEVYQADRGVSGSWQTADGPSVTAFYFEWDKVGAGPQMAIGGHAPEICNAAAGYRFLGRQPARVYESQGHALPFDTTVFADRAGREVYIFKLAWLQGFGPWEIASNQSRLHRLGLSFRRASGEGRVLMAGVFGAGDENHAWEIFQKEILESLRWKP